MVLLRVSLRTYMERILFHGIILHGKILCGKQKLRVEVALQLHGRLEN